MPHLVITLTLAAALLAAAIPAQARSDGFPDDMIRKPAVAGRFYTDNPDELRRAIDGFLERAAPPTEGRVIAIVSPHAGYVFSGQTATDAFRQAQGTAPDLVVLLGVNHTTAGFTGAAVWPSGAFATPLGNAPVDEAAASDLLKRVPEAVASAVVHEREHSIEVLVPFVQVLFPSARILPVVVADHRSPDFPLRLGQAIADVVKGKRALIVASTDLSHYPSEEDAHAVDRATLEAMTTLDPDRFRAALRRGETSGRSNLSTCACGEMPVLVAMSAAKALGANSGRVVRYATSADSPAGGRDRVVGYGAVVFTAATGDGPAAVSSDNASTRKESEDEMNEHKDGLSETERRNLLLLARETVTAGVEGRKASADSGTGGRLASLRRGAFVTLKKGGRLRGCIGHMSDDRRLADVVTDMAVQAAFHDPRFSPVTQDEIRDLNFEISVLTPFREVGGPDDVVIGQDGILIQKGFRRAVFLPQVASEQGWDRDTTLAHLCQKAGLPPDEWKKPGMTFFTFQAEVFGEKE